MPKAKKKIAVVFFETEAGAEPVRDWLKNDIGDDDRKIIGADICTVELGWPIGMPVSRSMGDGLHEVRSNLSNRRIARVLFCVQDGQMILLHGFVKKSQKTPKADLDLAKARKKAIK